MKKQLQISYQEIICLENLFAAWQEFLQGKKKKLDVQEFGFRLVDNILQLNEDLVNFCYVHGPYEAFNISDPKPRNIHKATVRDRVLHHAIYRKLYPFFDKVFIADSYSCRTAKGTHRAIRRFADFCHQVSRNNNRTAWVLKCDIKRFFASIDHGKLLEILEGYIPDKNVLRLLARIVGSFRSEPPLAPPSKRGECWAGLPLGNLTSQLFCNLYMNEFDQFVKHRLKAKHYIRYADDFVLLSNDRRHLAGLILEISKFLQEKLRLRLHSRKITKKTWASGVDFLGWVHFPYHRILRRATKRRMFARIRTHGTEPSLQSYLGLLKHGNTRSLTRELFQLYYLFSRDAEFLD